MPAKKRTGRGIHGLRHAFQWSFFALFIALLTLTVWPLGHVFLGVFLLADPLIAANSLANGVWAWPMLAALAMLLAPLVLGRAFCGYICPTGTLIEAAAGRSTRRLGAHAREHWRKVPAFVLLGSAGLLLFASGLFLLLDPLALLTRTATVLLYPFLDRMIRLAGDVAYLAPPLRGATDFVTTALTGRLVFAVPRVYGLSVGVLGVFAGILGLNLLEPRLWCKHLCPLGALLGLVGRFAPAGRVVNAETCIQCGACEQACPMDAVRDGFLATDTSRCQLCMACADACPVDAISTGLRPRTSLYSPSRRSFIAGGGLALLGGFFTFTGLSRVVRNVRLIRPPGARAEKELLALCSRCGQCMKVCPTNVLQPSLSKAGLEGIFTPEMEYRVGACDWACNECGKVCPTSAIQPLELEVKRTTKIGRAYIDRNRCIPWADYKTCIVCQELCPVPDKAIVITEEDVVTPEGVTVRLQRPHVVVDRCIGCGVCEFNCPVAQESAITVRTIAE